MDAERAAAQGCLLAIPLNESTKSRFKRTHSVRGATNKTLVAPAQAGAQWRCLHLVPRRHWMPAYAGMTGFV
jgi:hypothetical protein